MSFQGLIVGVLQGRTHVRLRGGQKHRNWNLGILLALRAREVLHQEGVAPSLVTGSSPDEADALRLPRERGQEVHPARVAGVGQALVIDREAADITREEHLSGPAFIVTGKEGDRELNHHPFEIVGVLRVRSLGERGIGAREVELRHLDHTAGEVDRVRIPTDELVQLAYSVGGHTRLGHNGRDEQDQNR